MSTTTTAAISTETQAELTTILRVASSFGIFGSIALLTFLAYHHRKMKNPSGQIIIFLSILDLIVGCLLLIGPAFIEVKGWCAIQAFTLQTCFITSWLLGLLLALYSAILLCYDLNINRFRRTEPFFLLFCILLSLPFSIYIVIAKPNGYDTLLGTSQSQFCWISDLYPDYQAYFTTLPMLLIAFSEIFCIGIIVYQIMHYNRDIFLENYRKPYKGYLVRRALIYIALFYVSWLPWIVKQAYAAMNINSTTNIDVYLKFEMAVLPLQGILHFFAFLWSFQFNPMIKRNMHSRAPTMMTMEEINEFGVLPIGVPLNFETEDEGSDEEEGVGDEEEGGRGEEGKINAASTPASVYHDCQDEVAAGAKPLPEIITPPLRTNSAPPASIPPPSSSEPSEPTLNNTPSDPPSIIVLKKNLDQE